MNAHFLKQAKLGQWPQISIYDITFRDSVVTISGIGVYQTKDGKSFFWYYNSKFIWQVLVWHDLHVYFAILWGRSDR